MLQFKEDCENKHVLRNLLIDLCHIEITGLLKDEDEANKVVRSNRLQMVLLPDGRRVFRKGGAVVCPINAHFHGDIISCMLLSSGNNCIL